MANNPFTPRKVVKTQKILAEPDIVEYERYDELVKSNPDDPADFISVEKVREKSRTNRQEYIQSFADDVGIKNILRKLALSGDTSLLNQIERQPLPCEDGNKEMVQDITILQEENGAANLGDISQQLYRALPPELVKGRSFANFCDTITQAEIDAYIASTQNVPEKGE